MLLLMAAQPYTTTRMARRLDHKDARSKPLYHLMHLLRTMRERPRWIVLENVQVGQRPRRAEPWGARVVSATLCVFMSSGFRRLESPW